MLSLPPATSRRQRIVGIDTRRPHFQSVHRVNRSTRLHSNIIGTAFELKVEVLYKHSECDGGFQYGKLVANTFPCSATKGQKGKVCSVFIGVKTRDFVGIIATPAFHLWVVVRSFPPRRIECIRIFPQVWTAMKVPSGYKNICSSQNLDTILHYGASLGQYVFRTRPSNQHRWFWIESQTFNERISRLYHGNNIIVVGSILAFQHCSNFILNLLKHCRVTLCELKEGPGQHGCRCLVSSNQHCHQIVTQNHRTQIFSTHVYQKSKK
mmetsp:Transcript_17234/g.37705  ORF Transcript_17234/g.37705 Transcript_17234/m.37705 type:complete len:266 (-) Transcript_17234:1706-2503(-)